VALARNVGFDLHGGSWEDLFIGVICWDDDGLSDLELYEPEDLEAALARFEELRPT
jgi:hypothetical protein